MPNQTTYYSNDEYDRIEEEMEKRDKSFSQVVREALQEKYDIE